METNEHYYKRLKQKVVFKVIEKNVVFKVFTLCSGERWWGGGAVWGGESMNE